MPLTTRFLRAFAAVTLVAYALSAHAETYTYTYTGNPYTIYSYTNTYPSISTTYYGSPLAPFTATSAITGYFQTSSPLADNLNDYMVPTEQYSVLYGPQALAEFSNGVASPSPATDQGTSYLIEVSTNSVGQIDQWNISIYDLYSAIGVSSEKESSSVEDEGSYGKFPLGVTEGSNPNDPGTWTESINGVPVSNSPVPEPSTLALLVAGTLALATASHRRIATILSTQTKVSPYF